MPCHILFHAYFYGAAHLQFDGAEPVEADAFRAEPTVSLVGCMWHDRRTLNPKLCLMRLKYMSGFKMSRLMAKQYTSSPMDTSSSRWHWPLRWCSLPPPLHAWPIYCVLPSQHAAQNKLQGLKEPPSTWGGRQGPVTAHKFSLGWRASGRPCASAVHVSALHCMHSFACDIMCALQARSN